MGLVGSVGDSSANSVATEQSDDIICFTATFKSAGVRVWDKDPALRGFVTEAKRRGLNCGVGLPTSKMGLAFVKKTKASKFKIQTRLSSLGYYNFNVDGLYGKGTAALKAYNKEYLGDADLTKSANVKALLDDILKEKPKAFSNGDISDPQLAEGSRSVTYETLDEDQMKLAIIGNWEGSVKCGREVFNISGSLDEINGENLATFHSPDYTFTGTFTLSPNNSLINLQGYRDDGQAVQAELNLSDERRTLSGQAPEGCQTTMVLKKPVDPAVNIADLKTSFMNGKYSEAFELAQTLAVEGNPDAQLYLGKMYADGRGTLQVNTSAHMWFNIASMNGSDEAFEERKAIQSQMTPELINEAQKMAVACIKSDYKDCGLLVQPSDTKKAAFKMLRPTGTDLRSYFVGEPAIRRKQMQYALKKLGYYNSAIDGLYGNRTQTALQSYLFESDSVSTLNHLYDRLVSEVDVPATFPSRQQANKVKQQRNKVIASSQGYSKAQAQAICEPKARLAGLQASSSFSPSNSVVNCVNGGFFDFRCSEGLSGGAWGGVLAAIEEKEIEQDAYDAVMEACMVNLGWY